MTGLARPCFLVALLLAGAACDAGDSSGGLGGAASTSGGATSGGATSTSGGATSTSGGATSTSGGAASTSGGVAVTYGGAPVGGSGTCGAGALFCEDFESFSTGQAFSGALSAQVKSGSVSVEQTQHQSGAKSVKFTTLAGSGSKTAYLRIQGSSIFPVAGNQFYGRLMFLLESAPTAAVHWTFLQGGGLIPGQTYHALYRYGGQHPVTASGSFAGSQLMANYETPDSYSNNGPKSDCWLHAKGRVVPTAKWSCLEWEFNGPENKMRLWLDGSEATDLAMNGLGEGCVAQPATFPWTAPTFDHVDVGWESYQPDEARTLYMDDIVLAKEKIGCPQTP